MTLGRRKVLRRRNLVIEEAILFADSDAASLRRQFAIRNYDGVVVIVFVFAVFDGNVV